MAMKLEKNVKLKLWKTMKDYETEKKNYEKI